jgi:hypothetical protein
MPLALASSELTLREPPVPVLIVSTHLAHREHRKTSTRGCRESSEYRAWACAEPWDEDDEADDSEDEREAWADCAWGRGDADL